MTGTPPEFALVPLVRLKAHEQIETEALPALVVQIVSRGALEDPIWVARDSFVILNGHHRVAALAQLGAVRAPAWLLDYHDPSVILGRWGPGPPIAKAEVERRARTGELFPPKTTRHRLTVELAPRTTPLVDLTPDGHAPPAQSRGRRRSRSRSDAAGAT